MTIATSLVSRLAAEGVNFAPQIARAAARNGVDPTLLAAVAAQETGGPGQNGGANIVGDGGHGHGLFQIDDRWHSFACTSAAADPAKNADYAAGMLGGLLRRYGGNVRQALSAYNAGSPSATGTTTRWGDGAVLGYADSVLRHYGQLAHPEAVDSARAELPCDVASIAVPEFVSQTAVPGAQPMPWRSFEGLDSTGDARVEVDPLSESDGD